MKELELRAVQLAELELLKEFNRVCEELDIQYFLSYGTALGALRHKGFIPWDDNVDVGMLREEFDKFIEAAPKLLGDKYFLQSYLSEPNTPFFFAKLRLNDSLYLEEYSQDIDMHHGIWIDIYSYCNIPDDKKARRAFISKAHDLLQMFIVSAPSTDVHRKKSAKRRLKFLKNKVYYGITAKNERDQIFEKLTEHARKYQDQYTDFVMCEFYRDSIVPREFISITQRTKFEHKKFPVSAYADEYLTHTYGDWEKIPPEEDRFGHTPLKLDIPKKYIKAAKNALLFKK